MAVELHHTRSPRVSQDLSGKELQLLQEDGDGYVNPDLISPHQDQQANQRNGGSLGASGMEADSSDVEGDDGLEDDIMDKISSSPSIEDGGYSTPSSWPSRGIPFSLHRSLHERLRRIHITTSRLPLFFPPRLISPFFCRRKSVY